MRRDGDGKGEPVGLEAAGVEFDPAMGVVVDDMLQTSNRIIFAAGDCCFQYKFTHMTDALARTVIQNALFGFPFINKKASALMISWCTCTDPEIGHVGMYENHGPRVVTSFCTLPQATSRSRQK